MDVLIYLMTIVLVLDEHCPILNLYVNRFHVCKAVFDDGSNVHVIREYTPMIGVEDMINVSRLPSN